MFLCSHLGLQTPSADIGNNASIVYQDHGDSVASITAVVARKYLDR